MTIPIPAAITKQIVVQSSPMENKYFVHAISALNSMNKTDETLFCYDDVSKAINTLERLYKGFLLAAHDHCDFYTLPSNNFLEKDHDILGMVLEIKQNFPDVFPRQDRSDWRATKDFYREIRRAYSDSRYITYPDYSEFLTLRAYVNQQYELLSSYIKEGNLTKSVEFDYDHQL